MNKPTNNTKQIEISLLAMSFQNLTDEGFKKVSFGLKTNKNMINFLLQKRAELKDLQSYIFYLQRQIAEDMCQNNEKEKIKRIVNDNLIAGFSVW